MLIDITLGLSILGSVVAAVALIRTFSKDVSSKGEDHGITKAVVDRLVLDVAEIKADVKTNLAIGYDNDKRLSILESASRK